MRLTGKAHDAAAVSGRESGSNGFFLGYVASLDRWCLTVRGGEETSRGGADGTGPLPLPTRRVCSAAAPTLGVWTHLSGAVTVTAISPVPRIRMRLDVNGVTAGEFAAVAGGTGTAVDIGRAATGLTAAPSDNLWSGDIDDVRVYGRPLAPGELTDIIGYASNASLAGRWNLDEAGGTTAVDSSGKAHPLTLTTGAAFAPTGGNTGGGLVLDGVTGAASTAAPVVRTDQGFVLDGDPPLGGM